MHRLLLSYPCMEPQDPHRAEPDPQTRNADAESQAIISRNWSDTSPTRRTARPSVPNLDPDSASQFGIGSALFPSWLVVSISTQPVVSIVSKNSYMYLTSASGFVS